MDYVIPYDSTMFVRAAIQEVMKTLFEAIGLVILVVFLFLQNWRATLIPLLTVPVAIVGTFALFPLLGFSINMTSMFGLVLAIGIVVDDAIVVVEAVQRHIDEGMAPREATIQAMEEVSAPVVAIACILAAVFIPVAFLGGISGQIYRQFALTIAASVLISAFNALSLSPALSAMILAAEDADRRGPLTAFFGAFNRGFRWTTEPLSGGRRRADSQARAGHRRAALLLVRRRRALPQAAHRLPARRGSGRVLHLRPPARRGFRAARRCGHTQGREHRQRDSRRRRHADAGRTRYRHAHQQFQRRHDHCAPHALGRPPCEELQLARHSGAPCRGSSRKVPEAVTFAFGLPPILGLSSTGGFQYMLEDRAGGDMSVPGADRRSDGAGGPQPPRARAGAQHLPRPTFRNTKWTWIWPRCRRWAFPSPMPTTRCRHFSAAST